MVKSCWNLTITHQKDGDILDQVMVSMSSASFPWWSRLILVDPGVISKGDLGDFPHGLTIMCIYIYIYIQIYIHIQYNMIYYNLIWYDMIWYIYNYIYIHNFQNGLYNFDFYDIFTSSTLNRTAFILQFPKAFVSLKLRGHILDVTWRRMM